MEIKEVTELESFLQDRVKEAVFLSDKAFSHYYNYNVAAVIVDEDGGIFRGVNWEPANGATVCAEVGALSSYMLSNKKKMKYVITYGTPKSGDKRDDVFCLPCGSCRQRLIDFCLPDTIFIGVSESGNKVQVMSIDELLPHAFSSKNLEN